MLLCTRREYEEDEEGLMRKKMCGCDEEEESVVEVEEGM